MEPQPSDAEALAIANAAAWIAKNRAGFEAFMRDVATIKYRGELIEDEAAGALIEAVTDYFPDVCRQIDARYEYL